MNDIANKKVFDFISKVAKFFELERRINWVRPIFSCGEPASLARYDIPTSRVATSGGFAKIFCCPTPFA